VAELRELPEVLSPNIALSIFCTPVFASRDIYARAAMGTFPNGMENKAAAAIVSGGEEREQWRLKQILACAGAARARKTIFPCAPRAEVITALSDNPSTPK
jgi:hypothetical protein